MNGEWNSEVEYERCFRRFLAPWTEADLQLECEDCKVKNEDVTARDGTNLCDACYEKRQKENSILECDFCHVKSPDVVKRRFPSDGFLEP